MLTHDKLFAIYKGRLEWVDRMTNPKTLEYTGESKDEWKHVKYTIFSMYQDLRCLLKDGIPDNQKCIKRFRTKSKKYKPYQNKYPCYGVLNYRDVEYPIYEDDNGMCSFIVVKDSKDNDYQIQIDSCWGYTDWYYELDCVLDKIS